MKKFTFAFFLVSILNVFGQNETPKILTSLVMIKK